MNRSEEEPLHYESPEEQQLPQESTEEDQSTQESTLSLSNHRRDDLTHQIGDSIFSGLPDIVNLQEFDLNVNYSSSKQSYGSNLQALFSSDIPISTKSIMTANSPFCADTGYEGISDQSDGSSTFWDQLYSFLEQSYGFKWPTPSEIPILPEPEMHWYGSNLEALIDTPVLPKSEMDPHNMLLVDSDDPNRGKRVKDTGVEKSPRHAVIDATQNNFKEERLVHDKMTTLLAAALKELDKDRFQIQMILTRSDVSSKNHYLVLPKDSVTEYILPFLGAHQKSLVESSEGLKLNVYDEDEGLTFQMKLKKEGGGGPYILVDRWIDNFVKRRGLKGGDTIGFYWVRSDNYIPCFRFSVLEQTRLQIFKT